MKDRFIKRKLAAGDRPKTLYEYYVTGLGTFPFDMLRYDGCWPATGVDAALLECDRHAPQEIAQGYRMRRSIKMNSYREPTVDRWSSFLWSVGTEKLS